jgi:hypothetical protein
MAKEKRINEEVGYFDSIRLADGSDTFSPRLEQRIALLSRNEEEHTTFELCYVGLKGRTFLALCTLFEERLFRILTITTEEALALQDALKALLDDNSITITAPITDE